jgi:hypothetical protein
MTELSSSSPSLLSDSSESSSTVDTAKQGATDVVQSASQAGQEVAKTAAEEVKNVAVEAGGQAKQLLSQARQQVAGEAGTAQQRLAGGLRSLSQELSSMAGNAQEGGWVIDLTRQASMQTEQMAGWLGDREPGDLLHEAKSFARRRPGTFLVGAAAAGIVAGRMTRGLKDESGANPASSSTTSSDSLTVREGSASEYPEVVADYPQMDYDEADTPFGGIGGPQ